MSSVMYGFVCRSIRVGGSMMFTTSLSCCISAILLFLHQVYLYASLRVWLSLFIFGLGTDMRAASRP